MRALARYNAGMLAARIALAGFLAGFALAACGGAAAAPPVRQTAASSFDLNPSPLELTADTPAAVVTAQGDVAGVQYTPHADPSCTLSSGSIAIAGDGIPQTDVAGSPLMFIAIATGTPPASCTLTVSGSDGSSAATAVVYSAAALTTNVMNAAQLRRLSASAGTLTPSSVTITDPTQVVQIAASGFNGLTTSGVACTGTRSGTGITVLPASFTGSGTLTIAPYGQGALAGTCTVTLTDSTAAAQTLTVRLAAAALNKLTVSPNGVQFMCTGSSPQTCATAGVTISETGAALFRINNRPALANSCANAFNGPLKLTTGDGTYATRINGPQATVSFYGLLLAPSLNCRKIVIGDGGSQTVAIAVNQQIAGGRTAATAPSCTGSAPLAADPNGPHGLYVWNPYKVDGGIYEPLIEKYVLGNGTTPIDPDICGVSLLVPWSDVETSKGAFTWTKVDHWAAPYVRAGLRVNLLFADASEVGTSNTATPGWVFTQDHVGTVKCAGQVPYPNWLDPAFESDYEAFIDAAVSYFSTSASYATNVGYMRFGIGAGVESYPGHIEGPNAGSQPCLDVWKNASPAFSYAAWLQHTLNIVKHLGGDTTDKQLMVSLNYVSAYDSANPKDAYTYANAVAAAAAPRGIAMGTQNLGIAAGGIPVAGPSAAPHACDPTQQYTNIYWCQAFTRHASVVPFEFQPIASPINPLGYSLTIAHLFQYGLDNNAQIFEVYPQDWVFKDDPSEFPSFTVATQADYSAAFSATSLVLGRNH